MAFCNIFCIYVITIINCKITIKKNSIKYCGIITCTSHDTIFPTNIVYVCIDV